jgi:hypothetical protein
MIEIKKSTCADTRSCDWSKVTKEQLLQQSKQHIADVYHAISFFQDMLFIVKYDHDYTKISHIDEFHKDFSCGFKTQDWYDMHKATERHHLETPDGIRDDVNLIDVLECVADCVMAGMGRSGSVRPSNISDETLRKALNNTMDLLASQVVVVDEGESK